MSSPSMVSSFLQRAVGTSVCKIPQPRNGGSGDIGDGIVERMVESKPMRLVE